MIDLVDFTIINNELDSPYTGSKFESYKLLGAKKKGAVSERLISDLLSKLGYNVEMPTSSNHDRIVNGVKYELKTSTLNAPTYEKYSFLQIRPNQNAEAYMFIIIKPNDLRIFVAKKNQILDLIDDYTLRPQQGGGLKGLSREDYCDLSIEDKLSKYDTFSFYANESQLENLFEEIK